MQADTSTETKSKIEQLEQEVMTKLKLLSEMRKTLPREPLKEYHLLDWTEQRIPFSGLFGDKSDLILIHNMGKGCRYCTLWADGFVSLLPHFENRAAFVLVSPDRPEVQRAFAQSRGWPFKMLSGYDSSFTREMGFQTDDGHCLPGVSTFHKDKSGTIVRVARSFFGPGDPFCNLWHLFDMLKDGDNGWEPQYSY